MATILELLGDHQGEEPVEQPSAYSRGLRSGLTALEGEGHALVGRGAELFGANDFANEQYAKSRSLQEQSSREAPPTRFSDVHDLRSGFDYAAGLAGQMTPTVIPAIAASILTRRPIAAGTSVFAPVETADIVQRQQANPEEAASPVGARSKTALLGGVSSALAQSVVPGAVAERVAGRTAAQAAKMGAGEIAARAGGTALQGGAATAGGEGIKEIASGQEINPEAIKEAGVAGTVGAGLLAVPGAVAEGAHGALSRAGTSVADLSATGVAKAKDIASKGAKNVSDLYGRTSRSVADHAKAMKDDLLLHRGEEGQDAADVVAGSDKLASDVATEWLKGKLSESGLDPEVKTYYSDFLTKAGDATARKEIGARILAEHSAKAAGDLYTHLTSSDAAERVRGFVNDTLKTAMQSIDEFKSKSIGERVAETKKYINDLMNDPATRDDVKAKLIDAAQNIGDRAKQLYVLNVAKARELAQRAKDIGDEKVQAAIKRYGEGADISDIVKEFAGVKKSEDMSGIRQLVSDELIPAMKEHNPQSINDPETVRKAADSVRMIIERARKGERLQDDEKVVDLVSTLVGKKNAVPMLDRVMQKFDDGDVTSKEHGYQFLLDLHNLGAQDANMARTVRASLVNKKGLTDSDLKSAVRMLRSYADGTLMDKFSPVERALREMEFHETLKKEFGANAEKVLDAFEQDAASRQAALRQGESDKGVEGDLANHNLEEHTPSLEEPKRYPEGKLIPTHEEHVKRYGNDKSEARRLMEKAEQENPDRNVRFVSARELARERGMSEEELHAITKGDPDAYGQIVAGGEELASRITEKEAQLMRLDRNHSNSPSAIKTDKGMFDAVKITDVMRRKLPYIDGESSAERTRKAFYEGVGAALVHFKANLERLDPQTVVAYRNGKAVKVGEIKSTGESFGLAGQELANAKNVRELTRSDTEHMPDSVEYGELTDWQLRERAATLQSVMDDRVQRYVNHLKENGGFPTKENVKGYVMSEKNKQLRDEMDAVRKEISNREFDKKVEHGQESDLETEHREEGLVSYAKDVDIHTAVAEHGEETQVTVGKDGKLVERTLEHGNDHPLRVKIDESGQNIERMQDHVAKRPAIDQRARLIEATKDKPIESITVNTKITDEAGNELVWGGKADEHPGRMNAKDAALELNRRRDLVKQLMKCVRG